MKKLISSIILSLDGFVADKKGDLSMFKVEDEFFTFSGKLTEEADVALYGKGTYKIMQSYWPTAAEQPNAGKHDKEHAAWYNKVEKIVLSKTLTRNDAPNARIISNNVVEEINKLKAGQGKAIQIFGSPGAVRTLTEVRLIDEYYIFIYPVTIGDGIPLFQGMKERMEFKLLSCNKLSSGAVMLHYQKP